MPLLWNRNLSQTSRLPNLVHLPPPPSPAGSHHQSWWQVARRRLLFAVPPQRCLTLYGPRSTVTLRDTWCIAAPSSTRSPSWARSCPETVMLFRCVLRRVQIGLILLFVWPLGELEPFLCVCVWVCVCACVCVCVHTECRFLISKNASVQGTRKKRIKIKQS